MTPWPACAPVSRETNFPHSGREAGAAKSIWRFPSVTSSRRIPMRFDAAVIGAGPAGSTAARLLAAAGWRVALVEKSVFPRRKVCGEFLSATNLPLLRDALGDGFEAAAGPPVKRVALYAGAHQIIAPMPHAPG